MAEADHPCRHDLLAADRESNQIHCSVSGDCASTEADSPCMQANAAPICTVLATVPQLARVHTSVFMLHRSIRST